MSSTGFLQENPRILVYTLLFISGIFSQKKTKFKCNVIWNNNVMWTYADVNIWTCARKSYVWSNKRSTKRRIEVMPWKWLKWKIATSFFDGSRFGGYSPTNNEWLLNANWSEGLRPEQKKHPCPNCGHEVREIPPTPRKTASYTKE